MRLIDADTLIEKIRKFPNAGIRWFISAEAVFDTILNAPTIEPRKKGKWILGGYEDMYYICNCCQHKESEYYLKPKANFCPNCGADMRGEL